MTCRRLVRPTTCTATFWYRSSRATSTLAPESVRMSSSSRCRFIGLTATAMPPAFQVPIIAIRNWGTFCR